MYFKQISGQSIRVIAIWVIVWLASNSSDWLTLLSAEIELDENDANNDPKYCEFGINRTVLTNKIARNTIDFKLNVITCGNNF